MINKKAGNALLKAVVLFFAMSFCSCSGTKNVPYFQDVSLEQQSILKNTAAFTEPTIQPDDILSISILTIDPSSSTPANQSASLQALGTGSNPNSSSQAVNGFLVDKNGEVELTVIGKLKLGGLTTFQAKDLIREKAAGLYKNPNVQVRFANFKITVLGEVNKPANYTLPNEKITIMDALGLAGDLTIYGKRENVLLIREKKGEKEFARLNLNSSEIFNTPYYYLRQNDVIYVEPNKAKIATTDANKTRLITIAASITSALLVLLIRVF